jgi:hypothetical protein
MDWYNLNDIIEYATEHHLENLIIDNTASSTFVENYIPLWTVALI